MFDMRMFLITCKGEAMHNPVFQDAIDHIVDQGEKLSGGSIDWLFLLKAESDRLNAKLQKLNAQIQTAKRGKDDERYQERNREIAISRLENRIVQALVIPKKRIKTMPTRASKERKLKLKKIRSEIKKNRRKEIF